MRDLVYISAQPADIYFTWQVGLWLQSIEDTDPTSKVHVLIYVEEGKELAKEWFNLSKLYPKALFSFYKDATMANLRKVYPPIIRPFILGKHFKAFPELSKKAIFYCDSDILFTSKLNIDKYLDDDINYLSNAASYIGAEYLKGKARDVFPARKEDYAKRDILREMCEIAGTTKELVEANQINSGGAQYLLKNIDYKFWEKVLNDCIVLKVHLANVNKEFFRSENEGFQSWCADMWAVMYDLLALGREIKVISEMEFAWATEPVTKLDEVSILHNAGVTGEAVIRTRQKDDDGNNIMIDAPAFFKGKFHLGENPYDDMEYLERIYNHPVSREFCTFEYVSYMLKNKSKLLKIYQNG